MRGGGLIIYYFKIIFIKEKERKNYEEDKQRFFTGRAYHRYSYHGYPCRRYRTGTY
jgi:hypothetical protein